MRLKRLSIKGFKSFADETDIHFNENLIGIVGPNGSGKSNVVDSIRWVLGEGKKSELRLADMKDVIFSGTKARKEGRVARVTLSFDNTKNILPTDYNEVSITRILYRDGNSEYRLNNVPCRRKDIMNLFIDSGVGSNSYAIISLNMVEDILHDSGGSRRQMIEQAAGISKYKIRKKETLSKLRSTDEDLDRVKDLLFEIEKNMSSFERQAKRTERFNKLKQNYKELAIKLSHIEVKEFSSQLKELDTKLTEEKDARLSINTELTQNDAVLQQLKTDILKYEKSLNEDQQAYNQLIEELGRVESDKNLALQKLANAQERLGEIDQSSSDLLTSKELAETNKANGEKVATELREKLTEAENVAKIADEEYKSISQRYEELRQRERDIKNEIQANQQRKERLGREIESFSTRQQIAQQDIETLHARIEEYEKQGAQSKEELETQKDNLQSAVEKTEASENAINNSEEDLAALNEKLNQETVAKNKVLAEHNSVEQRIKFLRNIIESHEGVPESVKWILDHIKEDAVVFSDIINVKNDRYTKISELFLEPYFHYLIADDKAEAIKMYEKVRDAQKGKLHLFVLEELDGQTADRHISGLVSLRDVIEVTPKYQPIIDAICKNVYISEERYNSSASVNEKEITVLYPDDFLVASHGQVYGGSNTLFEGVQLGRKRILVELEKKAEALSAKILEAQEKIEFTKKEISSFQDKVREHRNVISALRSAQEEEQRKLYQIENVLRNHGENVNQLHQQIERKKEELSNIAVGLEERNIQWAQLKELGVDDASNEELSSEVEEIHQQYIAKGAQREEAQRMLFEVRGQYDIAQKDVDYHNNSIISIKQSIDNLTGEVGLQKNIIEEQSEKSATLKDQLEGLYAQKSELQKKLSTYEDTYYKEKGNIFELEKKITELRNQLYKKDQLVNSLTEKKSTVQFDIKSIHERNSIEFGITINPTEFPEEYEDEDLEELRSKRDKINTRIRNYGEINPMAITAYNEIKERHDAISKERDDILEAKTALEETIAEIEKTASERFNESLEDIRTNFREVFQSLFSKDDDCDIILLDAEDPLSAKIEIIAKPKGKRPKSISQLSGGEKTLTAASFLFALYLLKPAPFCIFDEVDAPLDDVNVQKFNKIIRKFSDVSQFIVITHNKLTMAEVDVLYGVYLKEQGISGVSAVDFRNYDAAEMLTVNEA